MKSEHEILEKLSTVSNLKMSTQKQKDIWYKIEQEISTNVSSKESNTKTKWVSRHKKLAGALVGVAAVVGGVFGGAGLSPTIAVALDKTPGINQVYDWFGDPGLNHAVAFDNKVHISSVDRGITFTVTNVYYDQGRLAIQYQVNLPNKMFGKQIADPAMDFYVNEKRTDFSGMGGFGHTSDAVWQGMYEVMNVSGLSKNFKLQIAIHKIGNVRGYWQIQVPISGAGTFAHTKMFAPNVSRTVNGMTVAIKDITVTPATVMVNYEYTGDNRLTLNLFSNNGLPLRAIEDGVVSQHMDGNKRIVDAAAMFSAPGSTPNGLYVIPEIVGANQKLRILTIPMDKQLPISIDEGMLGKVSISHIDYFSNKTVLTMTYDGPLQFPIRVSLQKSNGEIIKPISGYVPKGNKQFTITYPSIRSSDHVKFLSMHYDFTDLLTNFGIQVPLNQ